MSSYEQIHLTMSSSRVHLTKYIYQTIIIVISLRKNTKKSIYLFYLILQNIIKSNIYTKILSLSYFEKLHKYHFQIL